MNNQGELALEILKNEQGDYEITSIARPLRERFTKAELRDAYLDASRSGLEKNEDSKLLTSYYTRVLPEHLVKGYERMFEVPQSRRKNFKDRTYATDQEKTHAALRSLKQSSCYAPSVQETRHDKSKCKSCIMLKKFEQGQVTREIARSNSLSMEYESLVNVSTNTEHPTSEAEVQETEPVEPDIKIVDDDRTDQSSDDRLPR